MFGKKKAQAPVEPTQVKEEKPTPAYLRDDYPYKAIGDLIEDLSTLEPTGVLYEIKCNECEMSVRAQGVALVPAYERMMNGIEVENEDGTTRIEGGNGCIGCGNRDLVVRRVDMSAAPVPKASQDAKASPAHQEPQDA